MSGRVLCLDWAAGPVDELLRLGAEVTCVVSTGDRAKPRAAGFTGEVIAVADHTRVEDVLAGLATAGRAPADFAAVGTDDEFALVPAAVIGALGGARGLSVPVALALRDKAVQKQHARAASVPTAKCALVDTLSDVADCGVAPPLVIKPPAGAGTQRTWAVRSAAELGEPDWDDGPWLVEEFVPGEELHIDGVVRGGKVVAAVPSRYLHNVIGVRSGDLVASATVDDDDLLAAAAELTQDALAALGHTDGVFHLEAFHQDGALVFGECAGRIGGGMVYEAVAAKAGVNLNAEWAACLLGLPSPAATAPPQPTTDSVGWVNLPSPAGRIESLPEREEILARQGVIDAQLWKNVGDLVADPAGGSHLLVAKALVRAPREEQARAELRAVAEWFASAVRVEQA